MSERLSVVLAALVWLAVTVAVVWYQEGKDASDRCFADTPRMGACER
jgi:hypothetical protein